MTQVEFPDLIYAMKAGTAANRPERGSTLSGRRALLSLPGCSRISALIYATPPVAHSG